MIRVIFTPYARNPYQSVLKEELSRLNVRVDFVDFHWLTYSYDVLRNKPNVLHLHWTYQFVDQKNIFKGIIKLFSLLVHIFVIKCRRIAIIWTAHNIINHDSPKPLLDYICSKLIAKISNAIIVHCPEAKRIMIERFHPSIEGKMSVINHGNYIGIYENEIDQETCKLFLGIPKCSFVFGFFGNLRPYKNLEGLLEAFNKLSSEYDDVYLVVAGKPFDMKFAGKLKRWAESNPKVILISEHVPKKFVQVILNAADIMVCPFTEILTSGSIILFMSFAKPVISPKLGCVADVLNGKGGFLYNLEADHGLLESMRESIRKRDNLKIMGFYNFRKVRKYDWTSIASKTRYVYEYVIRL